ncbi:hypothetical protein C7B80_15190 [Cyanosarcina cf. burmensis CCALA 770]|nr:hypothetical protein C7B80_15190 [Cyanosarcina cf. burmensis CCALA 770]
MSAKTFKFQLLRGLSLSMGLALLLAHETAMAFPRQGMIIAQDNSRSSDRNSRSTNRDRDVVVDTEGDTTPTSRRNPGSSDPVTRATRFSCQTVNGEYTVVYQPESQPGEFFEWAKPSNMGGGWNSQRRCNEIARRLESYRPDGLLEMTTGVENSYNTVCVTTERDSSCRIVFTVPPGQDPISTRDRVFENLTVADSGQQTDAVSTYQGRQSEISDLINMGREALGGKTRTNTKNINLKPFLDAKDGGTGAKLDDAVQVKQNSSHSRLNPGNFR